MLNFYLYELKNDEISIIRFPLLMRQKRIVFLLVTLVAALVNLVLCATVWAI